MHANPAPPLAQAKAAFRGNASVASEDELMRAVHKGRWWVKELAGVTRLKKYRAMNARYGAGASVSAMEAELERRARGGGGGGRE